MSKKHTYRTVDVQALDIPRLLEQLPQEQVVVGIDVAKERQVVTLADPSGAPKVLCRFEHPRQTAEFLGMLGALGQAGKKLEVALEPTGTYGDALMYQCHAHGHLVYLVSPKKTHDAKELFDGVPSSHDAKDSTLVARLHAQGLSRRWEPKPEQERTLRALVDQREMYALSVERMQGQLEALMARHFPEMGQHLDVRAQSSALKLLVEFPDPARMAQDPERVRQLLRQASHGLLKPEAIEGVLKAAAASQGVAPVPAEQELMRTTASELLRLGELLARLKGLLQAQMGTMPEVQPVQKAVGVVSTAVLLAYLGMLGRYSSLGVLEKACGLNLKVSSSGRDSDKKHAPGLHITKRGPGIVRKYLYLATLRWLQEDPVARAWYEQRSGYTEQSKGRAVVALMRKLVAKLWHLSRGAAYDPGRLFDLRRLSPQAPQKGPFGRPLKHAPVEVSA